MGKELLTFLNTLRGWGSLALFQSVQEIVLVANEKFTQYFLYKSLLWLLEIYKVVVRWIDSMPYIGRGGGFLSFCGMVDKKCHIS